MIEDLKYELEELFRTVSGWYRSLIAGVANIVTWMPIIWKDRQWDYYLVYYILQKKLQLMEQYYSEPGNIWSTGRGDILKEIQICRILCDIMIADDYHEIVVKPHDEKWDKLVMRDMPSDGLYTRVILSREKITNEKDREEKRKQSMKLFERVDEARQHDVDYLFKMMSKKLKGWWD